MYNIFLKEQVNANESEESKTIYAKEGYLAKKNNNHWLIMKDGKIINQKKKNSTIFSFEETQFNLSNHSTKTTTFPKIKELATKDLIGCVKALYLKQNYRSKNRFLTCENNINAPATAELMRRLYLPFYLPVLALISCFLTLYSKDKFNYKRFKLKIFFISTLVLVASELSLSYSGISLEKNLMFIFVPMILFIFLITIFNIQLKRV